MHNVVLLIRTGVFLLFCLVLAGCAVEMLPFRQTQSLEATVQTVLAKQGYYQGPIDGAIGPATGRAIRNYQRDHRLTPTGTINPALVASMGLTVQENIVTAPYYTGYPACYPSSVYPAYYAPPAVIGVGWGGWPGGYGYRGYGGYGYGGNRGWCR